MRRPNREARAVKVLIDHTTDIVASTDRPDTDTSQPDRTTQLTPAPHHHPPRPKRILAIAAAIAIIAAGLGIHRLTQDGSSTVVSNTPDGVERTTAPTTTATPKPVTERASLEDPIQQAHTTTNGMSVNADLVQTRLTTNDDSPTECHEPTTVAVIAQSDSGTLRGRDEFPVPAPDEVAVARIGTMQAFESAQDDEGAQSLGSRNDVIGAEVPTVIAARGASIVRVILRSSDGTTEVARPTEGDDFTIVALRTRSSPTVPGQAQLAPASLTVETTLGPPIVFDLANSTSQLPIPAQGGSSDQEGASDVLLLDAHGGRRFTPPNKAFFNGRCVDDPMNLRPATSVPPPSDHARADIVATITDLLDGTKPVAERAALTDDPARFTRLTGDVGASSSLSMTLAVEPTSVTFTDDTTAVLTGTVAGIEVNGKVIRSGDRWLVTWQSICSASPLSGTQACAGAPMSGTYPEELRRLVPLPR
ncbi:MAG: hypothetical protein JST64_09605 [Actinobacteria bacterium]|nr:hypothetical protein [Actinomycetota bacterium]